MSYTLVVVRPFGAYGHGAEILDPQEIARVLACEHAACVVRVARPLAKGG
jgi:hypothetical protein